MKQLKPGYTVHLDFEAIKLPPVTDILVLGRKHPQGKLGVMESFKFIAPDEFDMVEVDDESVCVEAVLINKKILKRMPSSEVISILSQYVFPYVTRGEAIKVDFTVKLSFSAIKGELNRDD